MELDRMTDEDLRQAYNANSRPNAYGEELLRRILERDRRELGMIAGLCDRCGEPVDLYPNRGEKMCADCLADDVATTGVNIRVTDVGGIDYVHNTVRDRGMITPRSRYR